MSSTYGENIHLSIFGQSHSEAIGMSLDGIPAGFKIDRDRLNAFLARRAPGGSELSTARNEADLPEFLSGLKDDTTCGVPIAAIIRNTDTRSKDYSQLKTIPRPGHADYTAQIKYHGAQDHAGGGHFSGRLTAPLCIAGGICLQLLEQYGINIFTRIRSIGNIEDTTDFEGYLAARTGLNKSLSGITVEKAGLLKKDFVHSGISVIDEKKAEQMTGLILAKKSEGDSVGGVIECVITGIPAGLGDPMFYGMENRIAQAVFAIPAVKGIEFGAGFESSRMTGSENNDCYRISDTQTPDGTCAVITETNNCGGILGGITNSMPLVFRAAFKPTPSIAKEQKSVDLTQMQETALTIHGRHDPCIVPRALPCIEAAAALAVYDAYLGRKKELQTDR